MGRPDRPLDPDAGPLVDFAADLRVLRREAGNPTYRTLAQRTHYSATTLSDAAGGRKLPTLPVVLAYARACGGDAEVWRARWQEVADALKSADESVAHDARADDAADAATADGEASAPALGQNGPMPVVLSVVSKTASERMSEPESAPTPAPAADDRPPDTHVPQPAAVRNSRAMWARLAAIPLAIVVVITVAVVLDHGGRGGRSLTGTGTSPVKTPSRASGISSAVPASTGSASAGSSSPTVAVSAAPVAAVSASQASAAAKATGGSTTAGAVAAGVSWSAFSGPKCASSGAAALSFYSSRDASAPWHTTAVPGPPGYGCADPQYTHLSGNATSWRNDADWVFQPGSSITACRFLIYIPQGTWAGSVVYEVYPGDASNGYNGQAIAAFTINQASAEGGSWTSSPQISVSAATIDLEITDQGAATRPGAVADVVEATCS